MQYPDLAQLLDFQIERERRQMKPDRKMTEAEYDALNDIAEFALNTPEGMQGAPRR